MSDTSLAGCTTPFGVSDVVGITSPTDANVNVVPEASDNVWMPSNPSPMPDTMTCVPGTKPWFAAVVRVATSPLRA